MNNGFVLRALTALLLLTALSGCDAIDKAPPPPATDRPKIVVLGFDGVDPDFLQEWIDAGRLPNLKKLAAEGTFVPLGSTNPPQSPVAWATFATGMNPGKHGIYDFVRRDPASYLPAVATSTISPPEMRWGLWPSKGPEGHNPRRGESFWKIAADAGVRVTVISVPYTFPPDEVAPTGRQLSGLGTPDLLGTNSTFYYFGDDLQKAGSEGAVSGGRLVSIQVIDGRANAILRGPTNPASEAREALTLPIEFELDAPRKRVTIRLGGAELSAAEGEWTPWAPVSFRVSPFYEIRGICRFYILEAAPELRVYGSPLNYDPLDPYSPISSPDTFSASLAEAHGLYKTLGWDHDTSGLNAERLDEKAFLEDAASVEDQKEAMLLGALDADDWDLLIWVSTAPDRVSHMFYRLIDKQSPRYDTELADRYSRAIEDSYVRMDQTVGKVVERLPEGATLVIISDHGFHSFRQGLHTNTWLVRNGYMKLFPTPESSDGKFSAKEFFADVDWSGTRAYAIGTGQVYLNLQGRERDGIVPRGEAADLTAEIAGKLEAFRDPETGETPLKKAYIGEQIFPGADPQESPDLQLAFSPGWRTSWETVLGGIPDALAGPNTKKWSGDHAASDVSDTAGIILVNERLNLTHPGIVDLAPTLLYEYGLTPPPDVEGERLW